MKTRLTLRPGQNGTKKLLLKYGGRLLAVRYRYDEQRRVRLRTVELVEDELPWVPSLPAHRDPNEWVLVRINYDEAALREAARLHSGRWDPERKLWRLRIGDAYKLGLDARIVFDGPSP